MTFDSIITIAAFCCYLIFMLCIGMYFVGKNRTTNEYFLGGRQLGSWVTSMSAQASDMSGWLLMGLPGAAYLSGISAGWIAIGWPSALTLTGCSLQSVCASTPKPQVMRLRCRSSSKTVSTMKRLDFGCCSGVYSGVFPVLHCVRFCILREAVLVRIRHSVHSVVAGRCSSRYFVYVCRRLFRCLLD